MTHQEFKNRWLGSRVDFDGVASYQCVDVVKQYIADVHGVDGRIYGNAADYFDARDVNSPIINDNYNKVANSPTGVPNQGDIIVWNRNMGGGYGHIAVVDSADVNTVTVIEQNGGAGSGTGTGSDAIRIRTYPNYANVYGWLRPKRQSIIPMAPNERLCTRRVNYRSEPNTSSTVIRVFEVGKIYTFKGYVKGESIEGNDIWFVGAYTGHYTHSSGFGDQSTDGLPNLNTPTPAPVPPPTPTPTPPPTPKPQPFTKDLPCVTEVIPAGPTHYQVGNFPAQPQKAVIHDFGTKGVDTIGSLINTFTNATGTTSSHFAVSGKRIIQLVSLSNRAHHAGPNGNDFIGIETDPAQDPDTIESTKTLLRELRNKYGNKLQLIEHNQITATACGDDVDLAKYEIDSQLPTPTPTPTPTIPQTTIDTINETNGIVKAIKDFINRLVTAMSRGV